MTMEDPGTPKEPRSRERRGSRTFDGSAQVRPAHARATNKRRYGRRPLFRPLTVYRLGLRLSTGRTMNLSPAGAYVIMSKPIRLRVGDTVLAEVDVPRRGPDGLQFEQVATPAWVRRIEDLGQEQSVALEFLEEVDVV